MAKKKAKLQITSKRRPRTTRSREVAILSHLTLQTIRLIESNSKIVIRDGKLPTENSVTVGIGQAVQKDEDKTTIVVAVRVSVDARPPGVEADSSRMSAMVVVECIYTTDIDMSKEDAEGLAGMGALAAWPHVREYVSSITMRMGQPPILLPLLLLHPVSKSLMLQSADGSLSEMKRSSLSPTRRR